ncbi:MAG: LamG domain-containing protein [Armatimonadetes bacterium]|nr:LamG domain-containing protein [Armatimonadota bacterium]
MRNTAALLCLAACAAAFAQAGSPLAPFEADGHTLLLYHLDEGTGAAAKDSSKYGYDGELQGAVWAKGRYGGGLRFDGKKACVFRQMTETITGLRQITVECWFNQDNPEGRQFLLGKDVTFHYDLSEGSATSLSIYNEGGGKPNAEGRPHQHLGFGGLSLRLRKWHHNAVTYDGQWMSFFVDGVLRHRVEAARDFSLGVNSRGLWLGCYVGMDFWFSGLLDEVRVSDCVRYDPERKLAVGGQVFAMPGKTRPVKAVRQPVKTGLARLDVTLRKRYGGDAAGWVYLQPPRGKAAIVGQYALHDAEARLSLDVSDELAGDGTYVLGLEPTEQAGYFAVTHAALTAGGRLLAEWTGEALSRRTFDPPVLVRLRPVGLSYGEPAPVVLFPGGEARMGGELEVVTDSPDGLPLLSGDGFAEYWVDLPQAAAWRVYLRYTSAALRPCDIVIDGDDLHPYNMAAHDRTETGAPQDALWRYQGTAVLSRGLHWIRIQDVLPDIAGLRLDPVAAAPSYSVPWERFPVPEGSFLAQAHDWRAEPLHGAPAGASATNLANGLLFTTFFQSDKPGDLDAGDAVRLRLAGKWDLEPFGRLTFRFAGSGSGHVAALRLVDAKGDEKLLWQARDTEAGPRDVSVPVSFEGNDVFDPGHVVAVCLDLDEGNVKAARAGAFAGSLVGLRFERRDVVAEPEGYAELLVKARKALAAWLKTAGRRPAPLVSPGFRPWTKPVVPEEHPLFAAADPKPVTRATLGYGFHTTGARGISTDTLDDFHRFYDFGDICWPHIGICPLRSQYPDEAKYQAALQDFEKQLLAVRDRGLYVFDVWGYVPYEQGFPWTAAPEHKAILLKVFGDRFLGFDNGEQDGRYIGSYADRGTFTDRRGGWEDFVAWDKHVCADGQDYMNATGSLNFSHYYGERGARMLGLETAQGLPSDTLMFAFLRGAGKQYGRLTYQATSIWSRFGYNIYSGRKTDGGQGYGFGPHKGCSLSLHKRLFLSGFLNGHSISGSETSQFTADRLENGAPELSPLGRQHLDILEWTRKHPDRGVQYTPVAFMLDFHNGWNMPRHLYRGDKYKIWGKLPYEKGDYLIDHLFRLVWPGYEDASYLRNERGFLTPTPYGDLFDVLTNRCHPDILKQYTSLMLLGDVEITPEVAANLTAFVAGGGDLLLDARHAAALPAAVTGVTLGAEAHGVTSHVLATGRSFDEQPYTYSVLTAAGAKALLVNELGHPLLTLAPHGKGRVIVCAVDHWMTDALKYEVPEIVNMESPYRLLHGVRAVLDGYFASFSPVEVKPGGLGIQVNCFAGGKRLLVGLFNQDLFAAWQGTLHLRRGAVAGAAELWHGRKLPAAAEIPLSIAAGDVAMVELRLR